MASNWKDRKLGEFVRLLSGGTPSKAQDNFWGGAIPWVSAKDMKKFWIEDTEDHLTEEGSRQSTRIVPEGTTLILVRGMTLHNDVPICRVRSKSAFNQDVKAVLPLKGMDPEFLPYLLLANKQKLLNSVDSAGHGTGRLNTETLLNLAVSIPPINTQKELANFANSLNDKIDLTDRINETLEQISQALFRAWFIDFEPVFANIDNSPAKNANREIAELFPSEFENGIPKGWKVGSIGDIANIRKNSVVPNKSEEIFYHFSIPAFEDGKYPKAELGQSIQSNKYLVETDAVLVSKLNPRLFRVWTVYAPKQLRCITSTEFIVYQPKFAYQWSYLNFLLRSDQMVSLFQQHVTGTSGSHQRVNPETTLNFKTVIPDKKVFEVFNRLISPILLKIDQNIEQVKVLKELRDSLLPRLLSGKITVNFRSDKENEI